MSPCCGVLGPTLLTSWHIWLKKDLEKHSIKRMWIAHSWKWQKQTTWQITIIQGRRGVETRLRMCCMADSKYQCQYSIDIHLNHTVLLLWCSNKLLALPYLKTTSSIQTLHVFHTFLITLYYRWHGLNLTGWCEMQCDCFIL